MSQVNSTEAVTSVTGSSQTVSPGSSNDESSWTAKPILGQPTITKPRSLSNPAVVSGGRDRQGVSQGTTTTYQPSLQSGSVAAASLLTSAGKGRSSSVSTSNTRPPAIAVQPSPLGSSLPPSSTPLTAATVGHSPSAGSLRLDVTSLSDKGPPAPPPKSPRHNPEYFRLIKGDAPPLPTMGSGQSKAKPPTASTPEPSRQHQAVAPQANLGAPRSATLSPQHAQTRGRSPSPSPSQSLSPKPMIVTSNASQAPSSTSNGQPLTPTSMANSLGNGATKLMRKFAGRRKKSEDATGLFAKAGQGSDGESHSRNGSRTRLDIQVSGPRGPANHVTSPSTLSGGATLPQPRFPAMALVTSPTPISPPSARKPCPIPIPPNVISAVVEPVADGRSAQELTVHVNHDRGSVIAVSPGMASAVSYMNAVSEAGGAEAQNAERTHYPPQGPPPALPLPMPPSSAPGTGGPVSPVQENEGEVKASSETKEIWRKSDSTIGHHTIRQGGGSGNGSARNSRPVSMAESFQSAFTVVPSMPTGGNKRWSTLTADMDIGVMVEEDIEDVDEGFRQIRHSPPQEGSSSTKTSTISAKKQKRRSVSLNVGVLGSSAAQVAPSLVNANGNTHSGHGAGLVCYSASDSSTLPTPKPSYPAATAVSPNETMASNGGSWHGHSMGDKDAHQQVQSPDQAPPSATNLRQRFPGWSTSRPSAPPSAMPPLSNSAYSHGPNPGPRAPTLSLTNSLAPAAGLAKQAAKKLGGIGKKWVMSNSSSSSAYSSSSSKDASASQSQLDHGHGVPLGRTNSNQSSLASSMKSGATSLSSFGEIVHRVQLPSRSKEKRNRHTPNAPSGAYSMTSSVTSSSTSDSDAFFPSSGPMLGVMVRGPLKAKSGAPMTGVVFGQDLKTAVEQTMPIIVSNLDKDADSKVGGERERLVKELQSRMLPALMTRCAQHLLVWGVQEEGLFRVSGRASHIARLRSEFDTGVDYDMTSCHPGDLDPHAVASVFKAYLRELPEPILTNALHPLFEAAVARELETNSSGGPGLGKGARHPGLPSSPKANMTGAPIRKPPSLSTLAMPTFNNMPAASDILVRNLRSLVARLPPENRDLIHTVVQLMRATYQASKETKMPLSNLLLVFCPSLNMTPPLLKALCECEDIWSPALNEGKEMVVDIKREKVVLDIKQEEASQEESEEVKTPGAENHPVIQAQAHAPTYSPPIEQAVVNSPVSVEKSATPPARATSRPPVPTIYLDTQSHLSSSSLSSTQEIEARYDASMGSPPPLSSSAESVITPTSSSGQPSLQHLPMPEGKGQLSRKSSINALLRRDDGAVHRVDSPRPSDQGLVEFPSGPPLPVAQKRRSLALLSLTGFSSMGPSTPSSQDSEEKEKRGNKPSLRRLFTKRSTASLISNNSNGRSSAPNQHSPGVTTYTPSTPRTASSSTVSTPISVVTAPQSSTSMLPPVLDMAIETGTSLSFDLGFDVDDTSDDFHSQCTPSQAGSAVYASAVTSQVSLFTQDDSKYPYGRGRSESVLSTASSNHLGYEESEEDDDWMKTVLAAGDKI